MKAELDSVRARLVGERTSRIDLFWAQELRTFNRECGRATLVEDEVIYA